MNRRTFISSLAAVAGGLVLPERRRVYSFPSVPTIWTPPRSRLLSILAPNAGYADIITIADQETADAYGFGAWWRAHCAKQVESAPLTFGFIDGFGPLSENELRRLTAERGAP